MRFVRSLGAQRIALIVIIALPAILLTLRSGIERRDESAAHARDQGLQLARGISQQSELSVRGAGDLLRPIAALFAQRSAIASVDIPSCVTFLSTFVGPESEYVSVGLADANGRVRCASTETSPELELADLPFFTAATSGVPTARARLVTDVVTGEPALAVAWPVIGAGNRQIGLVFAAIDLQHLQPAELIAGLPAGSYATVVDGDGTILARVTAASHCAASQHLPAVHSHRNDRRSPRRAGRAAPGRRSAQAIPHASRGRRGTRAYRR
ncbi:MAG: cache domain-containing protein [Chloroflexi bacterium]|nr:cache domain-containing protein [Chloroflexota bacterium]MDA1003165.1 cache domain-containing protein [Chloroflexota bacterium]